MNITHHKNGEIKTLVEEAPYHPGYEDAYPTGVLTSGASVPKLKELTDQEIQEICHKFLAPKGCTIYTFARAILRKAQEK